MVLQSNRKSDTRQESVITQFLENRFFSKYGKPYEIVRDKERQVKGIDVILNGKNIDIKAQSSKRYINNPTDTFLLEISFLNKNGEEMVGWFLNNDLLTDYYAFVWIIDATVNESGGITIAEDIHKAEMMFVDKRKLQDYIATKYDASSLLQEADRARVVGERVSEVLMDGIKFSHTPTLFEKPCNLVVKKSLLNKFSVGHYFIYGNR